MKKWFMVIDVAKCENCNNCFLACKDEHVNNEWPGYTVSQPDREQKWIDIKGKVRGQFPLIDVAYLPTPCMHCDDAPCIKAARNEAIYKRPDGIVIIDPVKSSGQKNLVNTCPYDVISWNEMKQVPQKCTLCAHLLDDGWTKTRCTQSCPTGALSLRQADDRDMPAIISAENLESLKPDRNTRPRVFYRNLFRFDSCFLGGSVAVRVNSREECAAGASVTLFSPANQEIGKIKTDNYGDFKFDDLPENSGVFRINIELEGFKPKVLESEMQTSLNLGNIFLDPQ